MKLRLLIFIVCCSLAKAAAGQAVSVNFVGPTMAATELAGVVQKSHWNNAAAASGTVSALVNENGTATAAAVTWKSDNTWQQSITDQPGNVRMMKGYLDNGNQNTTTVTVNGLPASANGFSVYVYAQGAGNGTVTNTGIYQISGTGITTSSVSLTYNNSFNGTFTQATASNANGNYVVFTLGNVSGFTLSAIPSTSSSGNKRAPLNGIQIIPVAQTSPDFSISATPASQSVNAGASGTYTVIVVASNGFANPVSLAVSGLPAGTTGVFSPVSITPGISSQLTVSVIASTPAGNLTLVITGTSGTLTHTASVVLSVAAGTSTTDTWSWQTPNVIFPTLVSSPCSFVSVFNVLTNTGQTTLLINTLGVSSNTIFGAFGPPPGQQLLPGQSVTFTLFFEPRAAGTYSGNLSLQINGHAATLPLSGVAQ